MKFPVTTRILYVLICLSFLDVPCEILTQTFPILADTINDMNNHTLMTHYGITPTVTRSALLILSALCQVLSAYSQSAEFFIMSKLFEGLQHPLGTFLTALFIAECAPDKNRGFACTSLVVLVGIVRMIMLPIASPAVLGKADTWFVFPLAALISSFLVLIWVCRLPESPKWLVCQNRIEEAKRSIEYYHGNDSSENFNNVLLSIVKEKNLTIESHISLREVLQNDTLREGFKVLFSFLFFILIDSDNALSVYTVLLHKSAGFTTQEAININLIISIVFFPTQFIGTLLIDYLGRRPAFCIGGFMIFIKSCLLLLVQFAIYFFGANLITKIIDIIIACLGSGPNATGMSSLRILFITELFPPSARTSISQIMLFTSLAINSSLLSSFPLLYSWFPPAFFTPLVFTQMFFGIYLYRYMPETKGRAVCDIIESFDEEVASRSVSFLQEKTPLIRKRSNTHAFKRNSILNTSRTRALTFDHMLIPRRK
eukprot:NP_508566.2 Uncharacterized protein CELE_K09C4.4 [Caenorhabditis elegans]